MDWMGLQEAAELLCVLIHVNNPKQSAFSSQHSAVSRSKEKEREGEHSYSKACQDFTTLTLENLDKLDLADGVDGRSGKARRKL